MKTGHDSKLALLAVVSTSLVLLAGCGGSQGSDSSQAKYDATSACQQWRNWSNSGALTAIGEQAIHPDPEPLHQAYLTAAGAASHDPRYTDLEHTLEQAYNILASGATINSINQSVLPNEIDSACSTI